MTVVTMSGWYLGNLPSIRSAPNSLLTTFGSAGDILGKDAMTIDAEYNDAFLNDNTPGETITYDVGAGSVTNLMEIGTTYDATITLVDGTVIVWELVVIQATDGETFALHSDDPQLDQLETDRVESVTFDVVDVFDIQVGAFYHDASIPPACLCRGTRVRTPDGEQPVEELEVGDRVMTLSAGSQPVLWIGVQDMNFAYRSARHMPVEFRARCLVDGGPKRTLAVSPQHRVVLQTQRGLAFGPAKGFVGCPRIRQRKSTKHCSYYALLLPQHHVVFAEGAMVESFLPKARALSRFSRAEQRHVAALMGQDTAAWTTPALPILTRRETMQVLHGDDPVTAPSRQVA